MDHIRRRSWMYNRICEHGLTHEFYGGVYEFVQYACTLLSIFEKLYARKTGNNKMFLIKQLLALKYIDGTSMTDHLNNFQGIMNQLSAMGINFDEEIQGLLLLGSLLDSWEIF